MSRRLTSARRQKRALHVPPPGRKGNIKIPYAGWLECAKVILIEEGIGAVKVDRLAKRLKVTRGGFYYHFKSHHALLEALLDHWRARNLFVQANPDTATPAAAFRAMEALTDGLIHEKHFDPQFDMAVREWARISVPVAAVVDQVDQTRIATLRDIFAGLGCAGKEAETRAKIFYYHQIGYYSLGIVEDTRTREQNAPIYLMALCGDAYARAQALSKARAA